jgi:hypothetical protein
MNFDGQTDFMNARNKELNKRGLEVPFSEIEEYITSRVDKVASDANIQDMIPAAQATKSNDDQS